MQIGNAYFASILTSMMMLAVCIGALIVEASDNSTVNYGTNQNITAFSNCRKVTNNSGTGLSVYVPTQTASEWSSFYNNPPAGVTAAACGDTLVLKSALMKLNEHSCAYYPATNRIYCFGGSGMTYSNAIHQYDIATDVRSTTTATLPTARRGLACSYSASTSKIYCFGGAHQSPIVYLSQIIEYDPATNVVVTKSAALPAGRESLTCTTNSATGRIYCFGGVNFGTYYGQIIEYIPSTNAISTKSAALSPGRVLFSCVFTTANSKIYCFGGGGTSNLKEIAEYDPGTNVLAVKSTTLPVTLNGHSCAASTSDGKIYCFSGSRGADGGYGSSRNILEYSPLVNTIATKTPTLPSIMITSSCITSTANKIYCLGGSGSGGDIIEYTP